MSAAGSPAPAGSVWKEYKNQDGRPYWFHTLEKRSVWEKPDELKTPRERVIAQTKWKEYKSGERSYYVHSETKETTWTMPQELKNALSTLAANDSPMGQETASPQPHSTSSPAPTLAPPVRPQAESGSSSPAPALAPAPAPGPAPGPPPVLPARLDALTAGPPRPIYNGPPPGFGPPGPPPSAPSTLSSVAQNMSPAALGSPQDAFKHLLRTTGVTLAWTWEQTMRQIVTEPLYKALKSLAERKAVFADYQSDLRKEEEEARAQKRLAVKPQVVDLLKSAVGGAGKLQPYSSWKTVMKLYGSDRALKDAVDAVGENEVAPFWDEVKKDLKASEELSAREVRHRNMDLLMSLLRTFEADVSTRWRDAHRTVLESSEWKQDAHLSSMDLGDMITVFEEYMRDIEREETEKRREEDKQKARQERRQRAEFRQLMEQGRREGWIHSRATWPDVYKRLQGDERLECMLAQRGSTPLDLFFDAVDLCDRSVEARTASVESLIKFAEPKWEGVREDATWQDFMAKVQAGLNQSRENTSAAANGNSSTRNNTDSDRWEKVAYEDTEMKIVFENLQEAAIRASREARKRHERRIRHLIDDARYGLKKDLDDNMLREAESGTAWGEVQGRVEKLGIREWKRLDEEIADEAERAEVKKITWEKFCRRQKEKAEEASSSRKRKSEADYSGGVDDRDRARRREDRDRRRGGRDERDHIEDGGGGERRRSRDAGADVHREDSQRSKRRKGEEASPAPSTRPPAVSLTLPAGDDDDKEEGEV